MSDTPAVVRSSASEAADAPTRHARRLLHAAWWSFALVPFSFVAATLLGNLVLTALGHDVDSETDPSWLQVAVAAVPAALVLVIPAVMAVWFGRRAIAAGHPKGHEASIAGLVVGAALIGMNVVAVVLRAIDALFG